MMGFSHHPIFWGCALAFLGGVVVTELNKAMEKDEHNAQDHKEGKWVKKWVSVIAAGLLFWIIAGAMFHRDKFLAKSHLEAPAALIGLLAGYYWLKLAHLLEEASLLWKAILGAAVLCLLVYVALLLIPDSLWITLQVAATASSGSASANQADAWTVATAGLLFLMVVVCGLVYYLLRGGSSTKHESKPKPQSGGGGHH